MQVIRVIYGHDCCFTVGPSVRPSATGAEGNGRGTTPRRAAIPPPLGTWYLGGHGMGGRMSRRRRLGSCEIARRIPGVEAHAGDILAEGVFRIPSPRRIAAGTGRPRGMYFYRKRGRGTYVFSISRSGECGRREMCGR